jgi:hypothetical protein
MAGHKPNEKMMKRERKMYGGGMKRKTAMGGGGMYGRKKASHGGVHNNMDRVGMFKGGAMEIAEPN